MPPSLPIAPGSTIGLLGGGHVGRMTALAARTLGYRVHALDAGGASDGGAVYDRTVRAPLDDAAAAADVARQCDVVTVAMEQVPVATLEAAALHAPLRPGAARLGMAQDRRAERAWLEERGFRVARWRAVASADEAAAACAELGGRCLLKPSRRSPDPDAAVRPRLAAGSAAARRAFEELASGDPDGCVAEEVLDIEVELSVVAARTPSGAVRSYPPAVSRRVDTELAWSVLPGDIPSQLASKAEQLAATAAERLRVEGLLAVEMFLLADGRLTVNELVPCPHHTYHGSEVACLTSQFEQLVRAVCDLPLGATDIVRPAATVVLTGDLWRDGRVPPPFEQALRIPGVRLHLYGKAEARPGRRMGHLIAAADTPDEAVERAGRALHLLAATSSRAAARVSAHLPRPPAPPAPPGTSPRSRRA